MRKKERKEGRNEISPALKKGDADARPEKSSRPKECERSRNRTGGVSRLITLAPATSSREDAKYNRSTRASRERDSGRGLERETTLPLRIPKAKTTRRDDETLTEFSSDSRGAEREMEREREGEEGDRILQGEKSEEVERERERE